MKKKVAKKKLYYPPTKIRKRRIFFIALLAIMAILYFDYLLNLDHYKSNFETIIGEKTNTAVKISKVRLKLFSGPAISLSKVTFTEADKDQPSFHADKILCKFNLRDIIKRNKIHFDSITLINPQVILYADNLKNFRLDRETGTQKSKTPPEQKANSILKFIPRLKNLDFDKSTFIVNRIIAHSGSLTIVYPGGKDKTTVDNIGLVCQKVNGFLTLIMDGKFDSGQDSRLLCNITVDLANSKNYAKIYEKILYSQVDISLSANAMKISDLSNLLKLKLPERVSGSTMNISAKSSGIPFKTTEITARINPIGLADNQETNVDLNISFNYDKKTVILDKLITNLFKTNVQADGYYDIRTDKGEFYCFSQEIGLKTMQFALPFLKGINVQGTGRLYSLVKLNSISSLPDISGNLYLKTFTGYFKNLSNPVVLLEPITGKFSSKDIVFDKAKVQYGQSPLLLTVNYTFAPDEKLYLDLDKLANIQILDLMPYSEKKTTFADSGKIRKEKPVSVASGNEQTNRQKKANSHLPIYLLANIKNSFLNKAKLDSLFLDAYFEGNRMLLKNVDIRLYEGELRGNGVITFNDDSPDISFVADIDNVELNELLTNNTNFKNLFWGKMTAAVSFQCAGKTEANIAKYLRGQGTLKIDAGKIANLALIKQILQRLSQESDDNKMKLLGSTIGLHLPPIEELELDNETKFQKFICDFKIDKNEYDKNAFHSKELKLISPNMTISMNGNLDFEKNLDFKGDILLSKIETVKLLHKIKELSILFNIENEQMTIPFKLRGTMDEPKPSPIIKLSNVSNIWENLIHEKLLKKEPSSPTGKTDIIKALKDNEGILNIDSKKIRENLEKITEKQDNILKNVLDNDTINRIKSNPKSESINIDENDIKKFESISNSGIIKLDENDIRKIQKLQKKMKKYLDE